jgi:ribonuclease Z
MINELHPDSTRTQFSLRRAFGRKDEEPTMVQKGVILDEENLRIRAAFLEHSLPGLAYTFEEKQHVNFKKSRLVKPGAPVGPWLSELKRAVLRWEPDNTAIFPYGENQGGGHSPLERGRSKCWKLCLEKR